MRAGPEGLVAPDPRGQGELIGAVVPRLVLAAQGRGGRQGRVLGPILKILTFISKTWTSVSSLKLTSYLP